MDKNKSLPLPSIPSVILVVLLAVVTYVASVTIA